jgi:hypothetical protein
MVKLVGMRKEDVMKTVAVLTSKAIVYGDCFNWNYEDSTETLTVDYTPKEKRKVWCVDSWR